MSWREWFFIRWWSRSAHEELPRHLRIGTLGEKAAGRYLEEGGMKLLVRNFRSTRGEIDLICRAGSCIVFVEVKTRSSEEWSRPAAAVNAQKRRALSRTALDYLNQLGRPAIPFRFDIIEVLVQEERVVKIRHLPNAFSLSSPYRYGW